MSTNHIKVMVPPPVRIPRAACFAGAAAAWLVRQAEAVAEALHLLPQPDRRERHLRALAREVEPEQPALAAELRGIAMHWEAFERSAR